MADDKELKAEEQKALQAENKKLASENATLKEGIASQNEIISGLNQALIEKEVEIEASAKYPVFKLGKESYELVIPRFIHKHKGERIEVDQTVLTGNKELLAELVSRGSEALKLKG